MQNRVCHLFGIRYPIIQGGMVWRMETGLSRKQRRWIGVVGGWFHAPGNPARTHPQVPSCHRQTVWSQCAAYVSGD